jgi:predicted negative regulator of RcsB-dependent stress response
MREIASHIAEFLRENGIDPLLFLFVVAAVLFLFSWRSLREWETMQYFQKWMIVTELIASGAVTLFSVVMLVAKYFA